MVSHQVCQIIEGIEAESGESCYRHAPADYLSQTGITVVRIASAVLQLVKNSESLFLNRVVGLGVNAAASEKQLDEILDCYSEYGIRRYAIALSPGARPKELQVWLERRGLRAKPRGAKLYRDASPAAPPKTGYRVEEIGSDRAREWFEIVASVFPRYRTRAPWYISRVGAPGWRHYVAYANQTPVSAGAMYVGEKAAHLVDRVTLTSFRRKGGQSAIIQRRIEDGIKAGCDFFASETGVPLPRKPKISFRNLQRAGFELAYIRPVYVFERPRVSRIRPS